MEIIRDYYIFMILKIKNKHQRPKKIAHKKYLYSKIEKMEH